MSDDDGFDHRLLEQAKAYGTLYPSILPRLKAAFESGDPAARELVRAMLAAMERAQGHRERRLRETWGLSPQEVRVALHLADGGTVATCLETMGLAESTVRTHLKSVFAKTGCSRQSQLVALVQSNSGMSNFD